MKNRKKNLSGENLEMGATRNLCTHISQCMSLILSLFPSCLVLVALVWNWSLSLSRGHNCVSFGLLDVLVFRKPHKQCFSTPPQLYFSIQPLTSSVFQHLSVWSYLVLSCDFTCLQAFNPYPWNSILVKHLNF